MIDVCSLYTVLISLKRIRVGLVHPPIYKYVTLMHPLSWISPHGGLAPKASVLDVLRGDSLTHSF